MNRCELGLSYTPLARLSDPVEQFFRNLRRMTSSCTNFLNERLSPTQGPRRPSRASGSIEAQHSGARDRAVNGVTRPSPGRNRFPALHRRPAPFPQRHPVRHPHSASPWVETKGHLLMPPERFNRPISIAEFNFSPQSTWRPCKHGALAPRPPDDHSNFSGSTYSSRPGAH